MKRFGISGLAVGVLFAGVLFYLSCGGGGSSGMSTPDPITLVSVNSAGVAGSDGSEEASVSGDGRYVAFASYADNLVPGDTNADSDIFLRDIQQGVTSRVSVSTAGTEGFGTGSGNGSYYLSMSADGRYIVFGGDPVNFVPGDTNDAMDIFLRDTQLSITSRVSVSSMGSQTSNNSYYPYISSDGRYIAFNSEDGDLVAGDNNGYHDVFVRDTVSGETTMVSKSTAGVLGSWDSNDPSISDDGRYVAFWSYASNLVIGDSNGAYDAFVRDTVNDETIMVSVDSTGTQGNEDSINSAISGDGRFVVFGSGAINLVAGDDGGQYDIFMHELATGITSRVSVSTAGSQANGGSSYPAISPDGRYVAFQSAATNLVAGDNNNQRDIFVRDTQAGTTVRVSVSAGGSEANAGCSNAAISADGRYVVFESAADNLVADPVPAGKFQVYRAPNQ